MKTQKLKLKYVEPPKVNQKLIVKKLIAHLKIMYYNQDPLLNGIDNFEMLYSALCDLDDIVGMYDIKKSIVDQIKFLLVNYSGGKEKFQGHMLHTLLSGLPGVGKTTVGNCLANIWRSLGLLKKETPTETKPSLSAFGSKLKNRRNMITVSTNDPKEGDNSNNNKFDDIFLMALIGLMAERNKDSDKGDKEKNKDSDKGDKEKNENDNKKEPYKKYSEKSRALIEYKPRNLVQKSQEPVTHFDTYESSSSSGSNLGDILRHRRYTHAGINNIRNKMDMKKVESYKKLNRIKFGEDSIKITSRPDYVGMYVGHSGSQTKALLTETLKEGKVLFIDEAYSLILDEKDSFGNEALTEINRFMSENPGLIIIFAGYKEKMEKTIFRAQPGLSRRICWHFNISKYTADMLVDIFKKQLAKEDWVYEGDDKILNKFFDDNFDHFGAYGGDTQRMVFYCKLKYSEIKFDLDFDCKMKPKTITYDIFLNAYESSYCANKEKPEVNMSHLSMYV
jgi:DNA polymerase III delta prime subunit